MQVAPKLTVAEANDNRDYTIDELASVARVPTRTIRFYQARRVLMAPEIRGRVAYYLAAHVERLNLIAQLQDRGLRMHAIRDLVRRIDRGELDLSEWLGIEQQLETSWTDDPPRTVSESELMTLAGEQRPGLLSELLRHGLVERRGDVYLLDSPALLTIAMKLEAAGVDLGSAREAADLLQKHVERAVDDLIALFMRRASEGKLGGPAPAELLASLRPLGLEAVRVIFGRAMENGLRRLAAAGALSALPQKARRKRR